MRLLFVTPEIGWPLASGLHIRQWNVLQALRKCGEVDVLVFQPESRPIPVDPYQGCREIHSVSDQWITYSKAQRRMFDSTPGRAVLTFGSARPFQLVMPRNGNLRTWFANLVRARNPNVIWMSRATIAASLGWRDTRRTILDGDDYEFIREYQLLRTSEWYGSKVLSYMNVLKLAWAERQLPRHFARVVRCSDEDRQLIWAKNVAVVPNGAPRPAPASTPRVGQRVLFVGSLSYPPNEGGLDWFLRHIWPLVRARVPSAELDIAGRSPSGRIRARDGIDGIRVHGFVEDLQPLWVGAALSLAPLLAGSGTRLKILESLANTVPVVSTTIGAYGIDLGPESGLFRADRPIEFADRCAAILKREENVMSCAQRGRNEVQARYSWAAIHRKIAELVVEVDEEAKRQSVAMRELRSGRKSWRQLESPTQAIRAAAATSPRLDCCDVELIGT